MIGSFDDFLDKLSIWFYIIVFIWRDKLDWLQFSTDFNYPAKEVDLLGILDFVEDIPIKYAGQFYAI